MGNDRELWEPDVAETERSIDMTPTHKTAARIYVECVKHGDSADARAMAENELIFLGALADERNKFAALIRKVKELDPELLAKAEKELES